MADHPAGPLHVLTSCIDWEPRHGSRRPDQPRTLAALLTDPARDGPLPVLLTGDLNAPPSSPEIRALTEVAVDAWAPGGRVQVERCFLAGDPVGGVHPSDHWAVVADLRR